MLLICLLTNKNVHLIGVLGFWGFGDLTRQYGQGAAAASRTRGVFFAGQQPSPTYGPQIDYVTISSIGDAVDWGVDMTGCVGPDASWVILKILGSLMPLRVTEEEEYEGLDVTEHEERSYDLI